MPFPVLKNTYDHISLCSVKLGVQKYIQVCTSSTSTQSDLQDTK